MATIEVSTWAQLRNAVTSAANGDTIKLISDINCNDEIPEGVASSIVSNATQSLTIDGSYQEGNVTKRHVIRNLRTSMTSPQAIFKWNFETSSTNKTFTIKNIDFINLILDAPLVSHYNNGSGYNWTVFRNCRFTGKRTDYLYNPNLNNNGYQYAYFYNCYFNIPYYGTSYEKCPLCKLVSDSYHPIRSLAYYCRFKETYTGTYAPDMGCCCGISYTWLCGCRVEGTIVTRLSQASSYYDTVILNTSVSTDIPVMQNVVDCDILVYNTSSVSNLRVRYVPDGIVKIPLRGHPNTSITFTPTAYSDRTILATEDNMKDTDWLLQHNFDVVPSNTQSG